MASNTTIVEVPQPPAGRLPFPLLLARLVSNPVASWGTDFYQEPLVAYHSLGRNTVFVMDPGLIQQVLLDDTDSYTKSPIHDDVLGEGGGQGLLIAEGELWRWQRRSLAPLFRAEDVAAYALQAIDADMAAGTLQVLEDTVLGAGLSPEDHARVAVAATTFLQPTVSKIAYASLGLPPGRRIQVICA